MDPRKRAAIEGISPDNVLLDRLRWMRSFGNDPEELLNAQVFWRQMTRDRADRLQAVLDSEVR